MNVRMARFSLAAVVLFACSGGELPLCSRDADCPAGTVCEAGLCAISGPRARLLADAEVIRMGKTVRVDASSSRPVSGGRLTFEFRVEPEGAGFVEHESPARADAVIRASRGHTDLVAWVRVREEGGRESEAAVQLLAENSPPHIELTATPDPFQPGGEVRIEPRIVDADGDDARLEWSLEGGVGSLSVDEGGATLQTSSGVEEVIYTVVLEADDGHGGQAEARLALTPTNRAPTIEIEDVPLQVEHRCEGDPLTCVAARELPLTIVDDGPLDVSLRRIDDETSPVAAELEKTPNGWAIALRCSPACPIAGSHRFEVEARDRLGASTTRTFELEVGNRPPILRAHDDSPLAREALGEGQYAWVRASGTVIVWEDPDGDPPAPDSIEWLSEQPAVVFDDPRKVDPTVRAEGSAEEIRDVELQFGARDINGASGFDVRTIPLVNVAPTLTFGGDPREGHEYVGRESDGTRIYRKAISVESLLASDEDGDELELSFELDPEESEGRALGVSVEHVDGTWYLVGRGAAVMDRTYQLRARVRDPFGGEAFSTGSVLLSNRPPTLVPPTETYVYLGSPTQCETVQCSSFQYIRLATSWSNSLADGPLEFSREERVSDPDGDPITIYAITGKRNAHPVALNAGSASPLPAVFSCSFGKCPIRIRFESMVAGCPAIGSPPYSWAELSYRAQDGLGGTSEWYDVLYQGGSTSTEDC